MADIETLNKRQLTEAIQQLNIDSELGYDAEEIAFFLFRAADPDDDVYLTDME